MSKKKNQSILVACGLIMSGVIIYTIVAGGKSFLPTENVWNKQEGGSSDSNMQGNSGNVNDKELEGKPIGDSDEVKKNQDIGIGDEFQINDLIYKITSVERTKEKKVYSMPPLDWPFYTVDENGKTLSEDYLSVDEKGTILNEYSYLVVNFTIKNTMDRVSEKYLNGITLQLYDDKDEDRNGSAPLLNDREIEKGGKDYFRYEFQPQEEKEVKIVYIIEDKYLDYNNLKLRIENLGKEFQNSDSIKWIKIKY